MAGARVVLDEAGMGEEQRGHRVVRAVMGSLGPTTLLLRTKQRDCFVCSSWALRPSSRRDPGPPDVASTLAARRTMGWRLRCSQAWTLAQAGQNRKGIQMRASSRPPLGSARARDRRNGRRASRRKTVTYYYCTYYTAARRSPSGRPREHLRPDASTTSATPARSRSEPRSGGGRWSVRAAASAECRDRDWPPLAEAAGAASAGSPPAGGRRAPACFSRPWSRQSERMLTEKVRCDDSRFGPIASATSKSGH